jgi:hypothetical protein
VPTPNSQIQPSAENTPTVAQNRACAERAVPSVGITQCACVVWMYTLPESSESPRWSIESGQCRNLREPNETRRIPKYIQHKRHDPSRKLSAATSSSYVRVAGTERLHRMLSENQHTNASNQVLTKDKRCAAGGPVSAFCIASFRLRLQKQNPCRFEPTGAVQGG